jgi:hypothetical protein
LETGIRGVGSGSLARAGGGGGIGRASAMSSKVGAFDGGAIGPDELGANRVGAGVAGGADATGGAGGAGGVGVAALGTTCGCTAGFDCGSAAVAVGSGERVCPSGL